MTVAKVVAYAVGGYLVGLDCAEVIAGACPGGFARLDVVIDAQRGDLSVSSFRASGAGRWERAQPARLVPATDWLAGLDPGVLVAGPALVRWSSRLPAGQAVGPVEADPGAFLELAWRAVERGEWLDLDQAEPHYFRPATAEERRQARARTGPAATGPA
jgi:tRNA A37 threonylcarbamoyladenosine modification protein TsaB